MVILCDSLRLAITLRILALTPDFPSGPEPSKARSGLSILDGEDRAGRTLERGTSRKPVNLTVPPESSGPGATIDDYETWVSDRLRAQETV